MRSFSGICTVLVCAALLVACATPMASREVALKPASKKGIVVASFTNAWMKSVVWKYRSVGGSSASSSGLRVSENAPDAIRVGDQSIYVFEVPEGEYEFFAWEQDTKSSHYESVETFAARFRSYPGRATYVGNLELLMTHPFAAQQGPLGPERFGLDVKDLAAYDVPAFLQRYPQITPDQVLVSIMNLDAPADAPAAWVPQLLPRLELASLHEPADDPGARVVRFTSAHETGETGSVLGLSLSEKPGDAAVVAKEFSDGVVTYTAKAGFGRDSRWAAVGISWTLDFGQSANVSDFRSVTFRLASNVPSLRVALRGPENVLAVLGRKREESVRGTLCAPVRSVDVTPELREYTLPLSSFVIPKECRGNDVRPLGSLSTISGFHVFATTAPDGKPVRIAAGTTVLRQ